MEHYVVETGGLWAEGLLDSGRHDIGEQAATTAGVADAV
jgi:hypothetical protein